MADNHTALRVERQDLFEDQLRASNTRSVRRASGLVLADYPGVIAQNCSSPTGGPILYQADSESNRRRRTYFGLRDSACPVRFLNSLPFRLGSLCFYSFTKLSTATRPGSVLTARISLPLRTITGFRCARLVVREPVQSEFTV